MEANCVCPAPPHLPRTLTQMLRRILAPNNRSAPLPIKVDGFSVGAVMGFSEQHTVITLATDADIQAFTRVRSLTVIQLHASE